MPRSDAPSATMKTPSATYPIRAVSLMTDYSPGAIPIPPFITAVYIIRVK